MHTYVHMYVCICTYVRMYAYVYVCIYYIAANFCITVSLQISGIFFLERDKSSVKYQYKFSIKLLIHISSSTIMPIYMYVYVYVCMCLYMQCVEVAHRNQSFL